MKHRFPCFCCQPFDIATCVTFELSYNLTTLTRSLASLSRLGHVRLDEGCLIDLLIISGEIRQVGALGKEHRKTSAQKEDIGQLLQEKLPN